MGVGVAEELDGHTATVGDPMTMFKCGSPPEGDDDMSLRDSFCALYLTKPSAGQ